MSFLEWVIPVVVIILYFLYRLVIKDIILIVIKSNDIVEDADKKFHKQK